MVTWAVTGLGTGSVRPAGCDQHESDRRAAYAVLDARLKCISRGENQDCKRPPFVASIKAGADEAKNAHKSSLQWPKMKEQHSLCPVPSRISGAK